MAVEPQIYELLSQALVYPDEAFADRIQVRVQALSAPALWARDITASLSDVSLEDLQTEHVRLFVNAYGGSPCLPYESVYTEGRMLGEAAYGVAAVYAQWGVEETSEMADHAAVELAFAAQLARLGQLPEMEENRDLVRESLEAFERDHLRTWLPDLAAALRAAAALPFYRAVGDGLAAVFGAKDVRGRANRLASSSGDFFLELQT